MGSLDLLDSLAGRQHGLVTVGQLSGLGWSAGAQAHARRSGRLVQVRRGVLRLPGAPITWESMVLAACLAAGEGAVASHSTAARLWGLRSTGRTIEVSAGRTLSLSGVVTHKRPVAASQRCFRWRVPVTSAGRTLLDLGEAAGPDELARLVDEALRRNLVGIGELHALHRAGSGRGRPRQGAATLGAILADRPVRYDAGASAWERAMDDAWVAWGLPPASRQHEIVTPHGRYRPDRSIVELRIAVDWNGFEYHGGRRRFDADSDRRADLTAAGWLPLDFTSRSTPERICRTVRAVVEQRRRA